MKNIAIIGGGIIGMLSALVASKYDYKVIILDTKKQDSGILFPERYFSINLLSKYIFMKHGVWDDLNSKHIYPFNKIVAWDAAASSSVTFNSEIISYDYLGYILKESEIKRSLLNAIKKNSNITYKKNIKIDSIESKSKNCTLLYNKEKINCEILIAADGRSSQIAKMMQIDSKSKHYDQDAMVMNVKFQNNQTLTTSYQRFNAGDIQGLLPIGKNNYNLIWSMDNSNSQEIFNLDDVKLIKILNNDFSEQMGRVCSISQKLKFKLMSTHTMAYTRERVMLIGDAAHTVHPLAGLGLNMGIQDIFLLDLAFSKFLSEKNEISSDLLDYYENMCKEKNTKIINTINFLKKFYETTLIPSIAKKSLVSLFDNTAILKSKVVQEATGIQTLNTLLMKNYNQTHY